MRNYKRKGKQTHPDIAGPHNIPESMRQRHKVKTKEEEIALKGMSELYQRSIKVKGTNWTEEEMEKAIGEYFEFCGEWGIKPSKASLALYLGAGKNTLNEWANDSSRYGGISGLIKKAFEMIETSYVNAVEKYPTGNIFLLKTSHGHIESSKVDITSDGKQLNTAEDVRDTVSRLGLDK